MLKHAKTKHKSFFTDSQINGRKYIDGDNEPQKIAEKNAYY